jgi:hypothetical protein
VDAGSEAAAVDRLYDLRCKAVHQGWLEPWRSFSGPPWKLEHSLAYEALRHVVICGSIEAVSRAFEMQCLSAYCPGHTVVGGRVCSRENCGFSSSMRESDERA